MSSQAAKDMRACFYCANTDNFTEEKCECACHKVAPIWDKLEAIEKGLGWTIPQLIAIQKLLQMEHSDLIKAGQAMRDDYPTGVPGGPSDKIAAIWDATFAKVGEADENQQKR